MNELLTKELIAELAASHLRLYMKTMIRRTVIYSVLIAVIITVMLLLGGRIVWAFPFLVFAMPVFAMPLTVYVIVPAISLNSIKNNRFTVFEDELTESNPKTMLYRSGRVREYTEYKFRSGLVLWDYDDGVSVALFDVTEPGDMHYIIKAGDAFNLSVAVFSSKHYSYSENK